MSNYEMKDSISFMGSSYPTLYPQQGVIKYFRPVFINHGGNQEESWDKWDLQPDEGESEQENPIPWEFCFFDTAEKDDEDLEIPAFALDWAYEDKITDEVGPRLLLNHIRTVPIYVEEEDDEERKVYPLKEEFIDDIRLTATNYYTLVEDNGHVLSYNIEGFYIDPIVTDACAEFIAVSGTPITLDVRVLEFWRYKYKIVEDTTINHPKLNDDYGA